jgi:hypothetical protein
VATELTQGSVVAGFRVEALVGRGAMGEVYRARDGAGRPVALKLLDPVGAGDERFRQRFLREAEIAAGLDHPHIVTTRAAGDDDGRLYLAMDYIDGSDLRDLLRREGRLAPARAVAIIRQLAAALDTAHRAGLVHRDVKPGNILIATDPDGADHAYICDFGLARHVSSVSSLTGDRGFVGTIDYVPPEQIEGKPLDARADVYSLGCVLHQTLTGNRPYERDSELAVVFAHLNEPPPTPTDTNPDLPTAFDHVIHTALAKNPDDRHPTCTHLADAATAALSGRVLTRRRPHRRLAATTTALLTAAAALAAVLATRGGATHHPVTITQTSIASGRLGDSIRTLQAMWGGGLTADLQFPQDYTVLRENGRNLSAYFQGNVDHVVELTTSNAGDRTAEGIHPCSSFADLKKAYGKRLKASPNNTHDGVVSGWTVGKHLFFAMGPRVPDVGTVETIGVHSDELDRIGFDASNDGPCRPGPANVVARPAAPTKTAAPTAALGSHAFRPRISLRLPAGWHVRTDTSRDLLLTARDRSSIEFELDPTPVSPAGRPLHGVSGTPQGLVAWLRRGRSLEVSSLSGGHLGRPTLAVSTLGLGASRPTTALAYGHHAPALRLVPGQPVDLTLSSVRIATLVHTLAITIRAPTAARRAAARALLGSLTVRAVPVQPISKLSTWCTPVFFGSCVGELSAGTHRTSTFRPALTYTVPVGWTNFNDHEGVAGWVPPGGDWQGVDPGKSDYLGVFTSIATARPGCPDGASTIHTPAAFLAWLQRNPALTVSSRETVDVGGLRGYVVDLRMREDWKKTCPWSRGVPAAPVLTGLPPSPTGLAHGMLPQPMVMRLYLLAYHGGTLGIEVDALLGPAKLAAYSRVVDSFRFAGD